MANILLFGGTTVTVVPQNITNWLETYLAQGHNFIVGDRKGADTAFHRALSSVGALDRTTLYCMDKTYNNVYEIKEKIYTTYYNEEKQLASIFVQGDKEGTITSAEPVFEIEDIKKEQDIPLDRRWYEFRDKQMIRECDMAICLWDESKTINHMIQFLNILDKPCHVIKI